MRIRRESFAHLEEIFFAKPNELLPQLEHLRPQLLEFFSAMGRRLAGHRYGTSHVSLPLFKTNDKAQKSPVHSLTILTWTASIVDRVADVPRGPPNGWLLRAQNAGATRS